METDTSVDIDNKLRDLLLSLPNSAVVDILLGIISDKRLFNNPTMIKVSLYQRFKSMGVIK
jgi:hypothetical protein